MTIINTNSISGINSITAQGASGVEFYESSGVSQRLRITSAGDVGIGDAAPNDNYGTNLSVHSTATDGARLKLSDGTTGKGNLDGLDIISTGGVAYFINRENADMSFSSGSSGSLRITSGGNVNIGPSANANDHGLLTLSQSASAAFNALVIQQGNTAFTATDGLHIGIDAGVNAYLKLYENRDFYFTTGTSNTEKLRITSGGNIGIGTDSPQRLLHLHDGTATGLKITNNQSGSGSGDGFDIYIRDDNQGVELVQRENSFLTFHTNNTEALHINSTGLVGIGTEDPSTLLHISGSQHTFRIERDATGPGYLDISLSHNDASRYGSIYFGAETSGGTSDFIFRHGISSSYAEKFRIDKTGNYVAFGGATIRHYGGSSANSTSFDIDIPFSGVSYPGGLVFAQGWHFGNSGYGASRASIVSVGPSGLIEKNIENSSTGLGGSWSFSRVDNSTIRVSKVGGSYGGGVSWNVCFIGN